MELAFSVLFVCARIIGVGPLSLTPSTQEVFYLCLIHDRRGIGWRVHFMSFDKWRLNFDVLFSFHRCLLFLDAQMCQTKASWLTVVFNNVRKHVENRVSIDARCCDGRQSFCSVARLLGFRRWAAGRRWHDLSEEFLLNFVCLSWEHLLSAESGDQHYCAKRGIAYFINEWLESNSNPTYWAGGVTRSDSLVWFDWLKSTCWHLSYVIWICSFVYGICRFTAGLLNLVWTGLR